MLKAAKYTTSLPHVLTARFVLTCLNLEFHLAHTMPDHEVRLYGNRLVDHETGLIITKSDVKKWWREIWLLDDEV